MKTRSTLAALFLIGGLGVAMAADAVPESHDPIKMMTSTWSSITIQGMIAGQLLQKLGYNVDYVPADDSARYPAFENGDLTFAMETWATTQKAALEASLATGKVLDLGSLDAQAKEEWWYPLYMKEKCPGLPNWEALKDAKCVAAFSTPETAPKGRYLSAPADWGGFDDERVEALNLPFEVVHAGSEAAMFAELQSAYERHAPILVWVYSPHWVPTKFKGEWVQFPKYEEACYKDPKWGINPDKAYDCGKPEGWIKKMAWAAGEKKWPCAYQVIRNYNLTSDQIGQLSIAADLESKKPEDVAKDWIEKRPDVWKRWMTCGAN